jgi:hypothetical protein
MLKSKAKQWLDAATAQVERSARRAAEKTRSAHVRLGVTGLSGSGKTVFTTALAHALLHARDEPSMLAFLGALQTGQIVSARTEPLPRLPLFPAEANARALASAAPHWPAPTHELCGLRIVLRFRAGGLWRSLALEPELRIDIVDYPGEWLVDLPLLDTDFRAWSRATWQDLAEGPAGGPAAAWTLAADAAPAPSGLDARAAAYRRLLVELKGDRFGWSWLTPGRCLTWTEAEWLASGCAFFPVPPEALAPGPLLAALSQRYAGYLERHVKPFYRDHLRSLDRQIVLVDLLGALARGRDSVLGTRRALGAILAHFRYGGWWRLLRPLLGRRIGRVMVAATKADLVTKSQHLALRSLLRETVQLGAMKKLEDEDQAAEARTLYAIGYLASVRSTSERYRTEDGVQYAGLLGRPVGFSTDKVLRTSDVPPALPAAEDWPAEGFVYRPFEPPDLSAYAKRAFPHIGLDKAIEFLIGDMVS